MIAALYVATGGCYFGLDGVDPWDEQRDARLYAGPWPVVAHPPCARWCRLAKQVEKRIGTKVGADGGTFAAALASVRRHGGVLEHPAFTLAWSAHDMVPPGAFGWTREAFGPGWVCEVSQAAYGHRAQKRTWLYYVGAKPPPPLDWRRPRPIATTTTSRGDKAGSVEMTSHKERAATPPAFRDALLALARGAR